MYPPRPHLRDSSQTHGLKALQTGEQLGLDDSMEGAGPPWWRQPFCASEDTTIPALRVVPSTLLCCSQKAALDPKQTPTNVGLLNFPASRTRTSKPLHFTNHPASGVSLSQQKRHYCSPLGHPSNHQAEAGCCYLKPPPHTPITPILGLPQEASQPGYHQHTFCTSASLSWILSLYLDARR